MAIDEKVELYNVSKYIRKIPKYRYNGSYVLQPGESVVIERDKINFFKPYAAIGVVVRNIVPVKEEEVEKEVVTFGYAEAISEKPVERVETTTTVAVAEEKVEEPVAEVVDVPQEEIVVEEHVEEEKEEVEEVKDVPDLSKLEDMNLNQLKEVAKSLGIKEAASIRKKADIRGLIRKFYEQ